MPHRLPACLLMVLVALSLRSAFAQGESSPVAVGTRLGEIEFGRVFGGDGRNRLSEFAGHPVLVTSFRDISMGMNAARHAWRLHEKFADRGLVVILVDLDGWMDDKTAAHGWSLILKTFGDPRLRVASLPRGLPISTQKAVYFDVLVGADGRLIAAGKDSEVSSAVEKGLEAEFDRMKKGWGASSQARELRATCFGARKLADAGCMGRDLMSDLGIDDEIVTALGEIAQCKSARVSGIRRLVEDGRLAEADRECQALVRDVKGFSPWAMEVQALAEELGSDASKAEIAQVAEAEKLASALFKGKGSAALAGKLDEKAAALSGRPAAAWLGWLAAVARDQAR